MLASDVSWWSGLAVCVHGVSGRWLHRFRFEHRTFHFSEVPIPLSVTVEGVAVSAVARLSFHFSQSFFRPTVARCDEHRFYGCLMKFNLCARRDWNPAQPGKRLTDQPLKQRTNHFTFLLKLLGYFIIKIEARCHTYVVITSSFLYPHFMLAIQL